MTSDVGDPIQTMTPSITRMGALSVTGVTGAGTCTLCAGMGCACCGAVVDGCIAEDPGLTILSDRPDGCGIYLASIGTFAPMIFPETKIKPGRAIFDYLVCVGGVALGDTGMSFR